MRLPHTVDVLRAPLVSGSYGSQIRNWGAASVVGSFAAFVQPQATSEQVADAQRVVTRWRLFIDPWSGLEATDRVVWGADTYDVDGDAEEHHGSNGSLHHIEAALLKVTGG